MSSKSTRLIKSFYVENLGCSKNQVDAELIISSLEKTGLENTADPEKADLIIINTCGFINSAKEESVNTFFSFRENFPDKKIIVAGCLAQRYEKSLLEMLPEADAVFGNKDPEKIPDALEIFDKKEQAGYFPDYAEQKLLRNTFLSFSGSVYVKIAEGCNNRCSYCAIPLIRGGLRSRAKSSILKEIKKIINDGTKEIILIAQDLASYGTDNGEGGIIDLISEISSLEGDFWLRLLYIYPDKFPMEILDLCKRDKRILQYFDLPFQHSSSSILKKMGRKGDTAKYLDLINKIRTELPEAVIRSTFLVNFPGETRKDFKELLSFQKRAELDWLGVFEYSREEDTPAYGMKKAFGQILNSKIGQRRKSILEKNQTEISSRRLERFVGKTLRVFIEEKVEEEDIYFGRAYLNAPDVDGLIIVHAEDLKQGHFYDCKIIKRNNFDLEAVPVK